MLIRADASPALGLGHVSRCTALAGALREHGVRAVFATHESHADLLDDGSREVRLLPDPAGDGLEPLRVAEGHTVRSLASELGATWVVIDHYGASDEYLAALDQEAWKILLLDDAHSRDAHSVDLVVNPSLGARAGAYDLRVGARALVGPRYAMLQPVFAERRQESLAARGAELRRVLIVMGGADTAGLTGKIGTDLLEALPRGVEVRAVVGPLSRNRPALEARARLKLVGPLGPIELAEEMVAAQVGVTTPSTTCWEMATLGLPAVVVQTADNQAISAAALARGRRVPVRRAGDRVSRAFTGPSGLVHAEPRRSLSKAMAELTDGLGAQRVAAAMLDMASPRP